MNAEERKQLEDIGINPERLEQLERAGVIDIDDGGEGGGDESITERRGRGDGKLAGTTVKVTLRCSPGIVDAVDGLHEGEGAVFPNRSEVIRHYVRRGLREDGCL